MNNKYELIRCSPAIRRAKHKAQKEYKDYAFNKDKGSVTDGKK